MTKWTVKFEVDKSARDDASERVQEEMENLGGACSVVEQGRRGMTIECSDDSVTTLRARVSGIAVIYPYEELRPL